MNAFAEKFNQLSFPAIAHDLAYDGCDYAHTHDPCERNYGINNTLLLVLVQ